MPRDIEPQTGQRDVERPDLARGGRSAETPRSAEDASPRDVFARSVHLPRGPERERVELRGDSYDLRASEVRILTTVGAFRVVPADDLRNRSDRGANAHGGDLYRLRRAGLVRTVAPMVESRRTTLVTLTWRGHELLETYRDPSARQTFYAGIARVRDLEHDAHVYRAYLRSADRFSQQGARVDRILLEAELKREYQQFLQSDNRDRPDSDGRPIRDREAIHAWADEHHLPVIDDRVQFPDVRVEYEWPDGRREIEDLEVMTVHYRGAHAAAKARAGFSRFRMASARVGGASGTGRGRPFDPRVAEEWL